MATIPIKVASRIANGIKRFQPIVESARKRDINESDTVVMMTGMISEIFGFDKYSDITTEISIRGTFCDLALKINNKLELLLEAKAIGIDLKDQHIKQAIDYAANKGLEWVILSNSVKWRIYKVIFAKPISFVLLCEIDFMKLNYKSSEDIESLFIFTKEAVSKALLSDFFNHTQAKSRFMIGNLVCSDPIINAIRKELKQMYPDIKVQPDEIKGVLQKEVLKREILEGDEAEEARKKINKVYRKKEKLMIKKVDVKNIEAPSPEISNEVAEETA